MDEDSRPDAGLLNDLLLLLKMVPIKASVSGQSLIASHEHYTTRVDVVPPSKRESEDGPIRAVVRVITELPAEMLPFFAKAEVVYTKTE